MSIFNQEYKAFTALLHAALDDRRHAERCAQERTELIERLINRLAYAIGYAIDEAIEEHERIYHKQEEA